MQEALAALAAFPRADFSLLPTPFHRLRRLEEELAFRGRSPRGVRLYCKRDDLTGPAFGGNKTRKLDFLVAEALARGVDTMVAVGARQSNFCRLSAAAAARYGLACHLVLGKSGEEVRDDTPRGNLLLDQLLGAELHLLETASWQEWEQAGQELAARLEEDGRRVYSLPVGGSTPRGALGYVEGFLELRGDLAGGELEPVAIVHASSSAGTQAGLLAGKALTGWPGRIVGMGVAKQGPELAEEVYRLATEVGELLGVEVSSGDVHVDDAYQGEGYGAPTAESRAALELFARTEGIMLDRVYTAKAAAGLLAHLEQGHFQPGDAVVFLHTGGNPELFA